MNFISDLLPFPYHVKTFHIKTSGIIYHIMLSKKIIHHIPFPFKNCMKNIIYIFTRLKSLSSAFLISRYILGLGQRGRCCFCAACPNRRMYLEIRSATEGGALRICDARQNHTHIDKQYFFHDLFLSENAVKGSWVRKSKYVVRCCQQLCSANVRCSTV